jgi:hypothetical protein
MCRWCVIRAEVRRNGFECYLMRLHPRQGLCVRTDEVAALGSALHTQQRCGCCSPSRDTNPERAPQAAASQRVARMIISEPLEEPYSSLTHYGFQLPYQTGIPDSSRRLTVCAIG